MICKVKFSYSDKSHAKRIHTKLREGTEVYRHPKGYYLVVEFRGAGGKFREAFWPEEVVKDKLFL